jgi:hypothetical protein
MDTDPQNLFNPKTISPKMVEIMSDSPQNWYGQYKIA